MGVGVGGGEGRNKLPTSGYEDTLHVNQMVSQHLSDNQSLHPRRKNTRAILETSPPIPRTQLEHSIKTSGATGLLSLPHYISTAQCQAALRFCKVGWCPFYKNINLQYITLHNFNLYRFSLPQVTHISFYKLKIIIIILLWLFTSGIIVNSAHQNLGVERIVYHSISYNIIAYNCK